MLGPGVNHHCRDVFARCAISGRDKPRERLLRGEAICSPFRSLPHKGRVLRPHSIGCGPGEQEEGKHAGCRHRPLVNSLAGLFACLPMGWKEVCGAPLEGRGEMLQLLGLLLLCASSFSTSSAAYLSASYRKDVYLPYTLYPEAGIADPTSGGRVHVVGVALASGPVGAVS